MAPFLQWPALHDAGFDVRCASIDEDDRSTFDELVTAASSYIDREACDRPCLLVGESFGGALATVVARQTAHFAIQFRDAAEQVAHACELDVWAQPVDADERA